MPTGRLEENPLRLPVRTFPVDLAYPRKLTYTLRLKLPDGYAVQELPQPIDTRLPLDGGRFQRMMEAQDTVLTVRTQLEINRSIFEPKHYTLLRAFYEQVVAAGAEQVVLKQTGTADDDTEEGGYR